MFAVPEPEEIDFVDGAQHLGDRALDDLVLQRRHAERALPADVVGIFPNEESIVRLIGAVLLKANDDWQLQHRYMQIEGMAEMNTGSGDDHLLEATPRAA